MNLSGDIFVPLAFNSPWRRSGEDVANEAKALEKVSVVTTASGNAEFNGRAAMNDF
jgi:hypothetical protein